MACEADELFYGGAAGGGKTDLLLGLALTAHDKSIIFRREYPQLKEIVLRAQEIVGHSRGFNGQQNLWKLPDGRTLEFGAVQHERDRQRYQGRAHSLKCFDELPHFTESQYRYLIGWTRTADPHQRCRVVATGNPPTPGQGEWIIQYWGPWLDPQHAHPAEPGELRWYAVVDGRDTERPDGLPFVHTGAKGDETITPRSRTFIPARVQDNPRLMASGYVATLQGLPEPLRSQLLYGDFEAGAEDDPWQVIPTAWVQLAQTRWREGERPTNAPLTALGVDVARGGEDRTVLAPRYGAWFDSFAVFPGRDTPDGPSVAALVQTALGREQGAVVNIDCIGVGSSPVDILAASGFAVEPINFGAGSDATDRTGKLRFRNLRAQAYWAMREALDPQNGEGLALPDDRELLADLCSPKWSLSVSGIQIEPKEKIASRLGRSPDKGDAAALALMAGGSGSAMWETTESAGGMSW